VGTLRRRLAPAGLLARVQECWTAAAGPLVAQEATALRERDGVVTVGCSSAVWAQELELLGPELRAALNGALTEPGGEPPVRRLRFVATGGQGD
jgi:predicted nucleic acid-binding Zn ribbon protein